MDMFNGFDISRIQRKQPGSEERRQKFLKACEVGDLATALEMALDDVEYVQTLDGVSIDMFTWISVFEANKCSVCVAGAVMLNTLGVPSKKIGPYGYDLVVQHWGDRLGDMLCSIDDIRRGCIERALVIVGSCYRKDLEPEIKKLEDKIREELNSNGRKGRARWSTYREVVVILRNYFKVL